MKVSYEVPFHPAPKGRLLLRNAGDTRSLTRPQRVEEPILMRDGVSASALRSKGLLKKIEGEEGRE